LLNDPDLTGLAYELYQHALINPRSDGKTPMRQAPAILPSYIEPRSFALALIDVIEKAPDAGKKMDVAINRIAEMDGQLGALLGGMYRRVGGDIDRLAAELAVWFDNGMARVGGAYKRQAQLVTFLIGFAIAGLFNVDTFHLFKTLWEHPGAAAIIAAGATPPDNAREAIDALRRLPVGWSEGLASFSIAGALGWLATATSVLFGGPFWFDLLQRFVNIRGAGTKPAEAPSSPGAQPSAVVTK